MTSQLIPNIKRAGVIFTISLFLILSCKKESPTNVEPIGDPISEYLTLPETPFNYANLDLPDYLSSGQVANMDNTPAHNPVTDHGATLGRVLFYDKNLSHSKNVSCSSCHIQEHGFSDSSVFSEGHLGGETKRHSMGLHNARYYTPGLFFWDERAATLEDQILMPIQDPVEMGLTLEELESRLKALPYYPPLFKNAFGSTDITSEKVGLAMAQFIRSIVSYQAKYDIGRAQVSSMNDAFPNFTEQENYGKFLFSDLSRLRCTPCHGSEAFIATGSRNNGLDATTTVDSGAGGITMDPNDIGRFKTPSLRGVTQRAPYMHDGRFATLEEVLDHYSSGIQNHPNLDQDLKEFDGTPKVLNITRSEKEALIAFFKTLEDPVLTTHEKYSDPFKE